MDSSDYVIIPVGSHMVELIKRNQVNVVAAIDYRNNGGLEKAGIRQLTNTIYKIGPEATVPFLSIFPNRKYYQRVANLLDHFPECKVIISGNYTPFLRFIIDHVGVSRVEMWEDGMNHYIGLEQISLVYYFKCFAKLMAGFYPKSIFDNQYKSDQLIIKDRFIHKNLHYQRPVVKGDKHFYIGQPLIEDNLISERILKQRLSAYFEDKEVYYLPHPREQKREWLDAIFTIQDIENSAEDHIIKEGASTVYSAFSTVNMNIQCEDNIYLCDYLGLTAISNKLRMHDFDIDFA